MRLVRWGTLAPVNSDSRHQEEGKEANKEESRTHLTGSVDLPVPATNPAATSTTATTVGSVATLSPPVYTLLRVFGLLPLLPARQSVENLDISRSEVKLNRNGLSSNPKRWKEFTLDLKEMKKHFGNVLCAMFGHNFFSNHPDRIVDLTLLVVNSGSFHFSYVAGISMFKLHCPNFPWQVMHVSSARPRPVVIPLTLMRHQTLL
uniref:uncharacterized protein LOC108593870 n=1 Tax=Callithrix jacchus TaxID=9483 RepID=UPI00159E2F9B|nr:uncharacterized protein LOC108593870 [Callithrix jacchus]XP_035122945.1 uncharacterized protein LOC108593870 [Callithrix jacchus]